MDLQVVGPLSADVDTRTLGGIGTLLVAGLLCLLYVYRRRTYILCWVSGWAITGLSMLLAARDFKPEKLGLAAYGMSQFLAIVGALGFVLAADAYRAPLRLVRAYALVLLPLFLWFSLAPMALPTPAAFGPGHLLIAGALAAAGIGHLSLSRRSRLLGAAVVGTTLLALAVSHVWLLVVATGSAEALRRLTFVDLSLYLVAALGMQLMAFEDMTYELRMTNTHLAAAQDELRQLVTTDTLTGCRNRRYFDEVIGREVQRHRRYNIPLSVVFIDVDRFKTINDTLGHEEGDRVLRRVAAFLIRNVREVDYVFRWGGDEFLILMSCREEEAIRKATDLQAAFEGSTESQGLPNGVGLSVGCEEVRADATDIMVVVKAADERMYQDKKR
jgi:diguanylate cyclase (GGDEF)-like protein